MKINISIKEISKNISFLELKELVYQFNKIHNKKEKETKYMFEDFKLHLEEQPDKEVIYSNSFVESLIKLYEEDTVPECLFLEFTKKAGYFDEDGRTDNFMEMMNFTHDNYGYDFGYIQDQAWYRLYPKYI